MILAAGLSPRGRVEPSLGRHFGDKEGIMMSGVVVKCVGLQCAATCASVGRGSLLCHSDSCMEMALPCPQCLCVCLSGGGGGALTK